MITPARPAAPAEPYGRSAVRGQRRSSNPAGFGQGVGNAPPVNVARRGTPEILIPPTGAPVQITSPVTPSTFSAWTALGTPANDLYLSQLWALKDNIGGTLTNCLVEFGYGAGPTPIDAVRSISPMQDPTADSAGAYPLGQPAQPVKVPGGSSLQARVWSSHVASDLFDVMALGYDSAYPVWDELPTSLVAGPGRYYDLNTGLGLNVTPGAWGTWGAWLTVIDPAPNDLLVTRLDQTGQFSNLLGEAWMVQVGFGAAGAEVPCSTHMLGRVVASVPIFPPVWIKAGERMAIRSQGKQTAAKRVLLKVYDR